MSLLKRNYHVIMLVALLISVIVFLFIDIILIGKSYLQEEVYVKNLVLDMMCDIAESGGTKDALIASVSEIDTLKQRGVYCAAYILDANSENHFRIISERTPLFGPYDPLDNIDLNRDIRLQNRGKTVIVRAKTMEAPAHDLYIYFRWVFQDTDEPIVIVLGMSKFSIETDHEQGLMIGAWLIVIVSLVTIAFSIYPVIKRKRGES